MGKKVLIVDDSLTVRQLVCSLLTEHGFEAIEAEDGIEGAEKIEELPDIALVILDVNMPRMNGLEMLQRVKSSHQHAALPVLMLTTEGQPELVTQAMAAGAKSWLVKPFRPEMLIAVVKKFTSS